MLPEGCEGVTPPTPRSAPVVWTPPQQLERLIMWNLQATAAYRDSKGLAVQRTPPLSYVYSCILHQVARQTWWRWIRASNLVVEVCLPGQDQKAGTHFQTTGKSQQPLGVHLNSSSHVGDNRGSVGSDNDINKEKIPGISTRTGLRLIWEDWKWDCRSNCPDNIRLCWSEIIYKPLCEWFLILWNNSYGIMAVLYLE